MSEEKQCPICGKPTSEYLGRVRKDGLCRKHAMQANAGKIEFCAQCKTWHTNQEPCNCNPFSKPRVTSEREIVDIIEPSEPTIDKNMILPQSIIIDKKVKCLTCGYETEGKLFCKKCYAKYCNKEILIKIKNCKEIVPLDDFYEGFFECDDGHVVKSMAEREIDNYLFHKNLKHGYEIPLLLTDHNNKKVTLHPDFCIFDEEGNPLYYIEYWGYDDTNRDYTKTKKYKMPLYKKAGITLININAKHDIRNLKTNLKYKIENYKTGQSNFEEE